MYHKASHRGSINSVQASDNRHIDAPETMRVIIPTRLAATATRCQTQPYELKCAGR